LIVVISLSTVLNFVAYEAMVAFSVAKSEVKEAISFTFLSTFVSNELVSLFKE
jgi:hypothetical protein